MNTPHNNVHDDHAPNVARRMYYPLPAILRPTVLKEKSYICRHKNLSKTKCKK